MTTETTGRWDLSILYCNFDDPKITADYSALQNAITEEKLLAGNASSLPEDTLVKQYLSVAEKINFLATKLYRYASLRYAADTGDHEASSWTGKIMTLLSETAGADAVLQAAIARLPRPDAVCDDPKYAEYRYFLQCIATDARYLLSEKEEKLFAQMNISGGAAWSDLQSTLTSKVKANYRGESLTLSAVRNLAYDPDEEVRRDAYNAELACYPGIADGVAFSLNSIKLQMLNECRLRGYASPLDKALHSSRMKKETLDALMGAIQEYLPKFWQYLRTKAKLLHPETTDGLSWWNLFAPVGHNDKRYTVEAARDYLLHIFGQFDSELHDMVETAFRDRWIDFYPREGKVGGAFDEAVPSAGQSRVLTNFDGAFGDIVTLAHELGHAFHDRQVLPHSSLTQDYSMPVAESASTFNEVLVMSTAIAQTSDPAEKLFLIESQLADATQIICDITSRYLFETAVFENRDSAFLPPEQLCQMMTEAQKQAYGDGLDPDTLHPYMWLCKCHYYMDSLSFYNFPYAFGGLFARGLYAKYQAEGQSFVATYKKLLYTTSITDVEDAALVAGIDLTTPDFWRQGLQLLSTEIDEFCSLCNG